MDGFGSSISGILVIGSGRGERMGLGLATLGSGSR